MSGQGHNLSKERLRSFIQRIERVEEEQKALASDKSEIYSEAKSDGFDPKIMRKVVALRKMDPADRAEQQELIGLYLEVMEA